MTIHVSLVGTLGEELSMEIDIYTSMTYSSNSI